MIPQCKGKDLTKIPKSKLGNLFYSSLKYDGHYVQIHKVGSTVRFFTSGGKEFYHELAADEILSKCTIANNFILEAEFIANTDGKLGNRGNAAKLTTYRTNFEKGLANVGMSTKYDTFKVFDIIIENMAFEGRLEWMKNSICFGTILQMVNYEGPYTLGDCKEKATEIVKQGYEGLYLKSPNHLYLAGKRVNDAIKLKLRPTADLVCIDVQEGEGKYAGQIGSLVLRDTKGRSVSVGSGLSDYQRSVRPDTYIGKILEIEYEQILDTYIQPTFVRIREDKNESD